MAKGIDVYTAYQTVTNWAAVRAAGYEFAYVKVSDGTTTRATNNYGPAGHAAGVKMGAYHYAQPGDPVAQANLLCDRATSQWLTDLAPALDLEAPFVPGAAAQAFAIAFLRQVKARGFRPCLYGNNAMLTGVLAGVRAAVPDVVVWAARYGADPTVSHDVHQWSQTGSVPGIAASGVDLNEGTVPLNTVTTPVPDQEDENMSEDRGEAVPTDGTAWGVLHVPVNGNRYLRVASSYNNAVLIDGISVIGDTPGTSGRDVEAIQAGGSVAADRPGPWDLAGIGPDYASKSHVVIRYKCDGPVKGWTNNRG